MTGYAVVIEQTPDGFSAWAPELPGVVAAAETPAECEALMREAIAFRIEGLIEDGEPVPPPGNAAAVVFVDPAAA
jgi:predicted RNase H-like HicB family nuclease